MGRMTAVVPVFEKQALHYSVHFSVRNEFVMDRLTLRISSKEDLFYFQLRYTESQWRLKRLEQMLRL